MGGAGRNAAPGALAKIVSYDMPDGVAVHSIEEILGWVGCMPPHMMQEMERLGGPLHRRSRFLVRGTFIFELAAECPPDYIRPIKSEMYWVDEDNLLLQHANHAGIEEAVRESLEAAMGSLQSKIEAACPPPAVVSERCCFVLFVLTPLLLYPCFIRAVV